MKKYTEIRKFQFFTMVELMIVIAIILILAAMLLPALMKSKNSARSVYCKNNLKQLGTSNLIYASEWEEYVAWGTDYKTTNLQRWHGRRTNANDNSEKYDKTKGPLYSYMKAGDDANCPGFAESVDTAAPSVERGGGGYGYNLYIGTKAYFVADPDTDEAYKGGVLVKNLNDPSGTVMFADTAMNVNASGEIESDPSSGVVAAYSIANAPFGVSSKATDKTLVNEPSVHFRHDRTANIVWADGHADANPFKTTINPGWEKKYLGFIITQSDNTFFDPN